MLSHVKSGAIYHNYSISPNISSSFFRFFFIILVFSAFYAPIQLHRSVGNSVIITTLPTRSARLLTILPLFSRAFAPLPTVIAGSYRKARACVSYDTGFRFLCYVASCLTIRASQVGQQLRRVGQQLRRVGQQSCGDGHCGSLVGQGA